MQHAACDAQEAAGLRGISQRVPSPFLLEMKQVSENLLDQSKMTDQLPTDKVPLSWQWQQVARLDQ